MLDVPKARGLQRSTSIHSPYGASSSTGGKKKPFTRRVSGLDGGQRPFSKATGNLSHSATGLLVSSPAPPDFPQESVRRDSYDASSRQVDRSFGSIVEVECEIDTTAGDRNHEGAEPVMLVEVNVQTPDVGMTSDSPFVKPPTFADTSATSLSIQRQGDPSLQPHTLPDIILLSSVVDSNASTSGTRLVPSCSCTGNGNTLVHTDINGAPVSLVAATTPVYFAPPAVYDQQADQGNASRTSLQDTVPEGSQSLLPDVITGDQDACSCAGAQSPERKTSDVGTAPYPPQPSTEVRKATTREVESPGQARLRSVRRARHKRRKECARVQSLQNIAGKVVYEEWKATGTRKRSPLGGIGGEDRNKLSKIGSVATKSSPVVNDGEDVVPNSGQEDLSAADMSEENINGTKNDVGSFAMANAVRRKIAYRKLLRKNKPLGDADNIGVMSDVGHVSTPGSSPQIQRVSVTMTAKRAGRKLKKKVDERNNDNNEFREKRDLHNAVGEEGDNVDDDFSARASRRAKLQRVIANLNTSSSNEGHGSDSPRDHRKQHCEHNLENAVRAQIAFRKLRKRKGSGRDGSKSASVKKHDRNVFLEEIQLRLQSQSLRFNTSAMDEAPAGDVENNHGRFYRTSESNVTSANISKVNSPKSSHIGDYTPMLVSDEDSLRRSGSEDLRSVASDIPEILDELEALYEEATAAEGMRQVSLVKSLASIEGEITVFQLARFPKARSLIDIYISVGY